ncbi:MAG: GIY-YIG nuclease family protein [Gallionella sp.]|nr:GIY-YIG nuclease family protein [Gallionella sp.]
MWFCYLLRCADGTLYCGMTNDLDKRVQTHNAGKAAKYTRVRLPVILVYTEECESRSVALKRELQIKALSRQAKLNLIAAWESQRGI